MVIMTRLSKEGEEKEERRDAGQKESGHPTWKKHVDRCQQFAVLNWPIFFASSFPSCAFPSP